MQSHRNNIATPAQIRQLWAEASRLRLDGDEMYFVLQGVTGKSRLEELTVAEAAWVLRHLLRLGGASAHRDAPPRESTAEGPQGDGRVIRLVSEWQREVIAVLLVEAALEPESLSFLVFARRVCGRSRPRTHAEAERLIEALKVLRREREGCPQPAA